MMTLKECIMFQRIWNLGQVCCGHVRRLYIPKNLFIICQTESYNWIQSRKYFYKNNWFCIYIPQMFLREVQLLFLIISKYSLGINVCIWPSPCSIKTRDILRVWLPASHCSKSSHNRIKLLCYITSDHTVAPAATGYQLSVISFPNREIRLQLDRSSLNAGVRPGYTIHELFATQLRLQGFCYAWLIELCRKMRFCACVPPILSST